MREIIVVISREDIRHGEKSCGIRYSLKLKNEHLLKLDLNESSQRPWFLVCNSEKMNAKSLFVRMLYSNL